MVDKHIEKVRVTSRGRQAELYAAMLFFCYAMLILFNHPVPSLTDYGDWTYEGVLLRNRMLGVADAAHLLKHYPVPNSATTVGIALLALLFWWGSAAKLWLCLLFVAAWFSTRHMMRSCKGAGSLHLIAPAAIFLNVNLWYGFINFEWGLCWAILVGSLLLRGERREWIFGVLLVLAFFSHMIPFIFAGLLVVLYAAQSGRFRLLWQVLPGAILSAWYVLGRFAIAHNADGNAGMISPVASYSAAFWAYKANSYLKSFGFINPGDASGSVCVRVLGPAAFSVLFLVNALLCMAIGWCLVAAALSAYRYGKKERFVWTAALIFLPMYLLAPGTALGISDPGSRLLQSVLAIVLFLCAGERSVERRLLRFGGGCAVALQVGALILFVRVPFSAQKQSAKIAHVPREVLAFSHVPNHGEDFYYRALEHGDMTLRTFPTALFLNTSNATSPLPDGVK